MSDSTEETSQEKETLEAEIRTLISSLDAPTSEYGDWKIIKIYEARLSGEDDPYDYDELKTARQEIRDKINTLQEELSAYDS